MFNVVVEIKAPEITEAIWALIGSLANTKIVSAPGQTASIIPAGTQNQQVQPQQMQAQPLQSVPAQQQIQQQVPQQQMQTQPGPVPTATQTYTLEQLSVAATQLIDAGRRMELVSLLGSFGVPALTAIPQDQYGNFATHLRSMGAKI